MRAMHSLISTRKGLAVTAGIVVFMTGIAVLKLHASGFFAANEVENGTLVGNVVQVTDASASGGKAVQFNAPASGGGGGTGGGGSSGSSCALPKYPSPGCTGVPAGTSLTIYNGDYEARTNGETINAKHITGIFLFWPTT